MILKRFELLSWKQRGSQSKPSACASAELRMVSVLFAAAKFVGALGAVRGHALL